jgi:hypothetical protein
MGMHSFCVEMIKLTDLDLVKQSFKDTLRWLANYRCGAILWLQEAQMVQYEFGH